MSWFGVVAISTEFFGVLAYPPGPSWFIQAVRGGVAELVRWIVSTSLMKIVLPAILKVIVVQEENISQSYYAEVLFLASIKPSLSRQGD